MGKSYKTRWIIISDSQTSAEICEALGIVAEKARDKGAPVSPPDSGSDTHPFTSVVFSSRTWPAAIPSAHELEEAVFEMRKQKEKLAKLAPPFRLHFACYVDAGEETSVPLSAELIAGLASLNAAAAVNVVHPS